MSKIKGILERSPWDDAIYDDNRKKQPEKEIKCNPDVQFRRPAKRIMRAIQIKLDATMPNAKVKEVFVSGDRIYLEVEYDA